MGKIGKAVGKVVGKVLGLKPPKLDTMLDKDNYNSNLLTNASAPTSYIGVVYGHRRKAGVRILTRVQSRAATDAEKKKGYTDPVRHLYVVYALSHGKILNITNPRMDDLSLLHPDTAAFVDWSWGDGSDTQNATNDRLISELTANNWDAVNGKLQGVAFAVLKLRGDKEFMNKLGNVTFDVSGKLVYDPRTQQTEWSDNPSLCSLDYLTNKVYGKGLLVSDNSYFISSANYFDELILTSEEAVTGAVTVTSISKSDGYMAVSKTIYDKIRAGQLYTVNGFDTPTDDFVGVVVSKERIGGREHLSRLGFTTTNGEDELNWENEYRIYFEQAKTRSIDDSTGVTFTPAHKRYTCNGNVDTSQFIFENLKALASSFNGTITFLSGQPILVPDKISPVVMQFNRDNIVGDISLPLPSKEDQLNKITATWFDPEHGYEQVPEVVSSDLFKKRDHGVVQSKELNLPFTNNYRIASRICTIELNKSRHSELVSFLTQWSSLRVKVGDVVEVVEEELGWAASNPKKFRVVGIGIPNIYNEVGLQLQPYFAEDYTDNVINERARNEGISQLLLDDLPPVSNVVFSQVFGSDDYTGKLTWSVPVGQLPQYYEVSIGTWDDVTYTEVVKYSNIVGTTLLIRHKLEVGQRYQFQVTWYDNSGRWIRSLVNHDITVQSVVSPTGLSVDIISPWAIEATPTYNGANTEQLKLIHVWYIAEHVDTVQDPEPVFADAVEISREKILHWNGVLPEKTYRLWCKAISHDDYSEAAPSGSGQLLTMPVVTDESLGVNVSTMSLRADSSVFAYDGVGGITPSIINFTAVVNNIDTDLDPLIFTAVPNVTLSGTGALRTLTKEAFDAAGVDAIAVTVKTTSGSISDTITVIKLEGGGIDGVTPVVGYLSNEAHSISADSSGTITGNLADAGGVFYTYYGITNVSSSAAYSSSGANGLVATIDPDTGTYAITSMSADSAYIDFSSTYNNVTITKRFTISKSKVGAQGAPAINNHSWEVFSNAKDGTEAFHTNNTANFKYKGTKVGQANKQPDDLTGEAANYAEYNWANIRTETVDIFSADDLEILDHVMTGKKYDGDNFGSFADLDVLDLSDNNVITNKLAAENIHAVTLAALSANLGEVTAGIITGSTFRTAQEGTRVVLNSSDIPMQMYDSEDQLTFTVDSQGKPFFKGGLAPLSIEFGMLTKAAVDILVPPVSGSTGGRDNVDTVPELFLTTITKTLTIPQANINDVSITVGVSDGGGFVTEIFDEADAVAPPQYRITIKRKINNGGWLWISEYTSPKKLFTGVANRYLSSDPTSGIGVRWTASYSIDVNENFIDTSHGANTEDELTYEISVTHVGGSKNDPKLTVCTIAQGVSGGGMSGSAVILNGQEADYYLDYDNFTNTPSIPTKTSEIANDSGFITSQRGISSNPANGASGTSISSDWAHDHTQDSEAHPRDTRNQVAGSYVSKVAAQIPDGANLNNYTDTGFYRQNVNAYADAPSQNYPIAEAGMLSVVKADNMTYQTYHHFSGAGRWQRTYYNGTWYPWDRIYDSGNKPTPAAIGAVSTTNNSSLSDDTRNTRGVTRLYRKDYDNGYSVQTHYVRPYFRLDAYLDDVYSHGCSVARADLASQATKLATARTFDLTGDVTTGAISFNGEGDVIFNVVVNDDSHNHIIDNVDGLQLVLDGKLSIDALNYNSSTTFAAAWEAVEQFKDWQQSGDQTVENYDLVTPAMAAGFINATIGQFNIVIAEEANVDFIDSRIIDVEQLFARDVTASNTITGATIQTRVASESTTPRVVLSNSNTPFEIQSKTNAPLFNVSEDAQGDAVINILKGGFAPNTLNDSQMFSEAGMTNLRERMGVPDPDTGGSISREDVALNSFGPVYIEATGSVVSAGNVMMLSAVVSSAIGLISSASSSMKFNVVFQTKTSSDNSSWSSWATVAGSSKDYYHSYVNTSGGVKHYSNNFTHSATTPSTTEGLYYKARVVISGTNGNTSDGQVLSEDSVCSTFVANTAGNIASNRTFGTDNSSPTSVDGWHWEIDNDTGWCDLYYRGSAGLPDSSPLNAGSTHSHSINYPFTLSMPKFADANIAISDAGNPRFSMGTSSGTFRFKNKGSSPILGSYHLMYIHIRGRV